MLGIHPIAAEAIASLPAATGGSAQTYTYVATGGLQTGGSAAVLKLKIPQIAGGLQAGGAAALLKVKAVAATGGLQSGGAGAVLKVKAAAGAGGAQAAGSAAVLKQKAFAAAGTIALTGGAATLLKVKIPSSVGGFQTTGAAPTSFSAGAAVYQYTGTGGFQLAGTAPVLKVKLAEVAGGLSTGGVGAVAKAKVPGVSGGLAAAGSAALAKEKAVQGIAGAQLAGSGSALKVKVPQAGGPSSFGGAALTSFTSATGSTIRAYTGQGGVFLDGAADTERPAPQTATEGGGGMRWLPRQVPNLAREVVGTGAIALGGAAAAEFLVGVQPTTSQAHAHGGFSLRGTSATGFVQGQAVHPLVVAPARRVPAAAKAAPVLPAPSITRAADGTGVVSLRGEAATQFVAAGRQRQHAAQGSVSLGGAAAAAFIAAAKVEHAAVVRQVQAIVRKARGTGGSSLGGAAAAQFQVADLGADISDDELLAVLEFLWGDD